MTSDWALFTVRYWEPRVTEHKQWLREAMDKVRSTLFPGAGGTDSESADGIPWWMKYLCKTAAILAASGISNNSFISNKMCDYIKCSASMFFGAWNCITISPMCLIAGVWQITAGFIMIVIEAPFCCMCLDFVASFAEMAEKRPPWQKALLYIV